MKTHMIIAINKSLNASGSNQFCSYDTFVSWITSIEGMLNVEMLWFVLFRTWDDKLITNELAKKTKTMLDVDFQNYHKHNFLRTLLNYALRQIRKTINNRMNALHGMTLQKSTVHHKVLRKNYYDKRKKMKFKEDFKKFRDCNARKKLCNKFYDAKNRPELKVEFEEVDISMKVKPD